MHLKIATYNVRNLSVGDDIPPGKSQKPRSERSLAALAEVIDRMDADVVSLQELSSKGTLEKHLLSRRGLAEKYPHIAYVQGNNPRGLNLGVLSKYPLTEVVHHKDSPVPLADGSGEVRFSHDLMRVDVNLNQDPEPELSIYNTCARSNPEFRKKRSNSPRPANVGEPSPEMRRLSEAQAIRNIAESEMKEFPGRLFVLTGDLQDTPDSPSVRAIRTPQGGEEWLDSLENRPEEESQTWPARPARSRKFTPGQVDHILYPERFASQMKSSSIVHYQQSLDSDTRWVSACASDHRPVVSTFEVEV